MGNDPRDVFARIGAAVERRWRERDYDEAVFPELAASVLREQRPDEQLTAQDILTWVLATDTLPQQFDPSSSFGQPPLTMYRAPRFFIDALFWMEATTDIHQHGFAGAFHVLAGSSVHSQYAFELEERISAAMVLGNLAFQSFEILRRGDTRTIGAGSALIHGLFHLERPSVTIVVRTYKDTECGPQYQYYPPSIGVDPFFEDPLLRRRLEALEVLYAFDRPAYETAIAAQAAEADFFALFRLARNYLGHTQDFAALDELLERARPRHGARVDRLPPVLQEIARIKQLTEKRRVMTGADHRFFLALLLNLPTRDAILGAVRSSNPERDPIELVMEWLGDLAGALLDQRGETADDDQTPVVLEHMLRGHRGAALIESLKRDFDDDDVERARDQVLAIESTLARAPMLRGLLR